MGDVATNDGDSGHQTRHFLILDALAAALRSVWGGQVHREPADHASYSPGKRPDMALFLLDSIRALDLKVFDPIGSCPGSVERRGAHVACGNTLPRARLIVRGRRQRGQPGDGAFQPRTGAGWVPAQPGEYAAAEAVGTEPVELLVETFGGMGPALADLLVEAAKERQDKLTHGEYDQASWGTRTWKTWVVHKISVAAHRSMAWKIARALNLGVGCDYRDARDAA